ncbi:hypothetical protein [Brevibacillus formosus]
MKDEDDQLDFNDKKKGNNLNLGSLREAAVCAEPTTNGMDEALRYKMRIL